MVLQQIVPDLAHAVDGAELPRRWPVQLRHVFQRIAADLQVGDGCGVHVSVLGRAGDVQVDHGGCEHGVDQLDVDTAEGPQSFVHHDDPGDDPGGLDVFPTRVWRLRDPRRGHERVVREDHGFVVLRVEDQDVGQIDGACVVGVDGELWR